MKRGKVIRTLLGITAGSYFAWIGFIRPSNQNGIPLPWVVDVFCILGGIGLIFFTGYTIGKRSQ